MLESFDALVRIETELWNRIETALREQGAVGLGTLQALRVLAARDGRGRVRDLCEEQVITTGAASKLADRLERAGLVTRTPNPEDRRSSLLVLTPAGDSAREFGEKCARAAAEQLLTAKDAAQLMPVLQRIRERVVDPDVVEPERKQS